MSVGSALSSVFGGGNDYSAVLPPTVGGPKQPGESDQQYAARLASTYNNQNNAYQTQIDSAINNKGLPSNNLINYGAANQTLGQEKGLANQLLAQGRGEGPNPALDQLRMTTDQNAKQGAGLIASQRGINPALAARLIGQNTANANQTAAGQAGLMSAQQQLGAQQAAGGLLGNISGQQNQQALSQTQAGLGLYGANIQRENALRQAQLQNQGQVNNVYQGMNAINAGVASQNAANQGAYGAGALSGISSALGSAGGMFAHGGEVQDPFKSFMAQKMADGGMASFLNYQQDPMAAMYGQLGQSANTIANNSASMQKSMSNLSGGLKSQIHNLFSGGSKPMAGDPASTMSMPGGVGMASDGGQIKGKSKIDGDSEANDVVPTMLSPGEIVIPRTAVQDPEEAHAFLDRILETHEGPNYRSVMKAREKFHKLAHGGDVQTCAMCHGGMA